MVLAPGGLLLVAMQQLMQQYPRDSLTAKQLTMLHEVSKRK